MSIKKILLYGEKQPRDVSIVDGVVTDVLTGESIPPEKTKGINHVLRQATTPLPYNAKLCSYITGTPYHFWITASDDVKARVAKVLDKVAPDLLEIRELELKKVFAKRSKRANNAKYKKEF